MAKELSLKLPLRVMVFGAGTMGHGIALLASKAGHHVYLVDADAKILETAIALIHAQLKWFEAEKEISSGSSQEMIQRIEPIQDYQDVLSSCDLIIEAITEDQTLKSELFKNLMPHLSPRSIVTSNTSYLNVFALAPQEMLSRLACTHFFVPPHLVPLVEVVGSEEIDADVIPWLVEVFHQMGQRPVVLKKFIPGFIVNRLQRAMGREVFNLLEKGIASPEEIDTAVQASLGIRMPVTGVVQKYDLTGLDLVLKILQNPSIHLANEDKIPRILKERIDAGDFGVKTGRGFYDYGDRPLEDVLQDLNRRFLKLRRFIQAEGIAYPTQRTQ